MDCVCWEFGGAWRKPALWRWEHLQPPQQQIVAVHRNESSKPVMWTRKGWKMEEKSRSTRVLWLPVSLLSPSLGSLYTSVQIRDFSIQTWAFPSLCSRSCRFPPPLLLFAISKPTVFLPSSWRNLIVFLFFFCQLLLKLSNKSQATCHLQQITTLQHKKSVVSFCFCVDECLHEDIQKIPFLLIHS